MVTLTDIDVIRASWLDPDDEFAQVVETSVNVTTDIPSRDYTHPDNHTSWTYGYNFKEKMELCLNKHALNFALFSFQFQLSSNLNS